MVGRAGLIVALFLMAGCISYDASSGSTWSDHGGSDTYDHKSVGNTPDSFGYSMSAGNKTKQESYDWSNGASRAVIGISGSVQEGSLRITLSDSAGLVVYDHTFTGTDSQGIYSQRGVPGSWTIDLEFEDYTGSLSLGISAHHG